MHAGYIPNACITCEVVEWILQDLEEKVEPFQKTKREIQILSLEDGWSLSQLERESEVRIRRA